MKSRPLLVAVVLLTALSLAACGGAGGGPGSLPVASGNPSSNGGSTQSRTEDAIDTTNSIGSPMQDINSYNQDMNSPLQTSARRVDTASGTCNNGVEFFSPDKNGDANSTERIVFYDNACTQMQSDTVRIFTSTGANSETVQRTVSRYHLNSTSPSSVRSETVNFSNATFDQYGYPEYKSGFDRTHTGELDINGVKTIAGDGEIVVEPFANNSSTFCSDSAGFNATGNQSLNETFGWAGMDPSGTRTVNSDGSVTWNYSHQGTAYTGAIGGLSIQAGVQNTSCPISTPMFTLAGGTAKGTYDVPIQATYMNGMLENLTISNATLVNGDTLNVQTNSGVSPSDEHFISGTLTNGGTSIASFNVDAFGDGTLVVTATNQAYQIEDWHVVK